jgi:predicted RNA-binding protein with PIN domain
MRLPSPLPPGVFDDDPAAADHLVRLPSAVLLVDGYNLSLRRWPERSLAEQRARLIDALNALVARVGVEVEVVFDGEEDSGRGLQSAGGRRRAVRVTFSPDDVDADEVLLARVDALPISRPVVVATDDRRVQREAGARGANVVGSTALFAALGLR